jgi:hypothetical protein
MRGAFTCLSVPGGYMAEIYTTSNVVSTPYTGTVNVFSVPVMSRRDPSFVAQREQRGEHAYASRPTSEPDSGIRVIVTIVRPIEREGFENEHSPSNPDRR